MSTLLSTLTSTVAARLKTTAGRVAHRGRAIAIGLPLSFILVFFAVPFLFLVVYSFFTPVVGGIEQVLTISNYVDFFTTELYYNRLFFTLQLSLFVTLLVTAIGYPVTYFLTRIRNLLVRRAVIMIFLVSMFTTYVVRSYAWTVLLSKEGVVSTVGVALGVFAEPKAFVPGYWAVVVGSVYVLLPFYVLTLYPSLRNIDESLIEASKNLGAGPLRTFYRVTLPLSKSGLIAAALLTYILTAGIYVVPRMLGNPSNWTIAVLIGRQINENLNIPFSAVMGLVLVAAVLATLLVVLRVTDVDLGGLGGEQA